MSCTYSYLYYFTYKIRRIEPPDRPSELPPLALPPGQQASEDSSRYWRSIKILKGALESITFALSRFSEDTHS